MPPTKTAKPAKTEGTWYARNGKTVITLPLSAEERDVIRDAAEKSDTSMARFVKKTALEAAKKILKKSS